LVQPASAIDHSTSETHLPCKRRAFISPFLPAFLAGRASGPMNSGPMNSGPYSSAATAVRLFCGPIAGRVADRFQLFRAELAACASVAAGASLAYARTQQSTHLSDCDFQH